jgi:YbbR domain-containing protein
LIQTKKIKQRALDNIWLLIFAFLTSLSLWFFVTYKGQTETIVEASLEYKNLPRGLEISRQNIKKVNLNIRGPERLMKNLPPSEMRVIVDLTNAKQSENTLYLDKENVALPKTIKVLRIEPAFVKITLDEYISRTLPVKAFLIGSPEKGYSIQSVKVVPSSVTVEGAKTEVSKVRVIKTEPLEVSGLDSDTTLNARLTANGRNVRIVPSEVNVTIILSRGKK